MIRNPVVAGQFYAGSPTLLKKEVSSYLLPKAKKIDAKGCVSPHAGYACSGPVAGAVLSHMKERKTYVILGPNHTGSGSRFGLDMDSVWSTPLGEVEIDNNLAQAILDNAHLIKKDSSCHMSEHSIEVQLPFLQVLNNSFKFVPIVVSQGSLDEYLEIGQGLAKAAQETKTDLSIIASSDMTHYEPYKMAEEKDRIAIEKILNLDIEGLLKEVEEHDISMCGSTPTAIMMAASLKLGAKKASLIKYLTSGDTCSDRTSVVGYAGIVIF
ncbi:MAG: AmmeMemoRadiSam system protein B [Candidatus Omnitrophica bacterium]|nr:AmmeMemoRadiSam system protein B [Candidatus Omnitrophota bacterium]